MVKRGVVIPTHRAGEKPKNNQPKKKSSNLSDMRPPKEKLEAMVSNDNEPFPTKKL